MDRWLWSFHSLNDKKIDKILNDAKGIIRVKSKSHKESYAGTTFIEHHSQAHKKLLEDHNRFLIMHDRLYVPRPYISHMKNWNRA
jgi:hypothetical protein